MSDTQDKLKALRAAMKEEGVDVFIVPRADEFQNEFPPPRSERLKWLTGFTGSGGVAVVTQEKAAVLTDGRYLIQIRQQIDTDLFEVVNIVQTPLADWIKESSSDAVVGYDPWIHTVKEIETFEQRGLQTKAVERNLVDKIWNGQPAWPTEEVFLFPDEIAGRSAKEKRELIAGQLKDSDAAAAIITQPDSLCWLLNIRGGDVDYAPLVLSYAIIHGDGGVDWIVDPAKVPGEVCDHLGSDVRLHDQDSIGDIVAKIDKKTVWLDFKRSPIAFRSMLERSGAVVIDHKDPCVLPKARKTAAEQDGIRQAHIRDGVAVTKFLHWLYAGSDVGRTSELDVVERLRQFRAEDPVFRGDSFGTIAGFGPNGAIVHYRATEESNLTLEDGGLLLVDSGGQYPDGTTDITRTMAIGEPSDTMRKHFTLVLKGHIALAMAKFPKGTVGKQIDTLARQPLWNEGLDFAHGTGHGVGCYLQVHEDAASISPRGQDAFEPGMLISNEPGYYKEGAYGIRIENLVLVQESGQCADTGQDMLCFETVTLAPIDRALIDASMLSMDEKQWLNDYHASVYEALSPLLDGESGGWLRQATEAIA